jgi:hypothetical protein
VTPVRYDRGAGGPKVMREVRDERELYEIIHADLLARGFPVMPQHIHITPCGYNPYLIGYQPTHYIVVDGYGVWGTAMMGDTQVHR